MAELIIPSMQPLQGTVGATGVPLRSSMLAPTGAAPVPVPPAALPLPPMQPSAVGSAPIDIMALDRGPEPAPFDPAIRSAALAAREALEGQGGAPAPGLPGPQAALEGAYGGNLAQWQAGEQALARMQPRKVSKLNPKAPIAKRKAREQLAGDRAPIEYEPFVAAEFQLPDRAAGETDAAWMERSQLAKQAHDADQVTAQQEHQAQLDAQLDVPDARFVGEPGEIGFIEAERRVGEESTAAQMQQAEAVANAETMAATARSETISEARQMELDRRDFREQQLDAVTRLQDVEKQARGKLEAMPAIAQKRRLEGMGFGQKILAVIAAMAGGAIGNDQINPMLEREVQRDLEVQKLNHSIGVRNYEATSDAVGMGLDVYRSILEGLGDAQAADQVYTNMMLEDGLALVREEAARTQVPVVKAELERQALIVEQSLRARRDATELQVATTPDRIATTVDPYRHERRRQEKIQDQRTAQLDKLELLGVDVAEKRAGREQAVTIEGIKQRGAAAKATATIQARTDLDIKKASDEWGAVELMVDDFLTRNPDNIHGVGAPLTGDQTSRIQTRQFQRALELLMTTGFTGATATERQIDQISGMIEGDWTEVTDEAFRTRMNSILDIASSRRRYYQKQLGSPDPRVQDTSELSTFQPR